MKKYSIGLIAILGILAVLLFMRSSGNSNSKTVFCSPDGTLSSTQSIQSHRSHCLKSDTIGSQYAPNAPFAYAFSIIDDQGNVLKDFQTVHEKIMHVIVVRKDLKEFQHVHPEYDKNTGEFTLNNLTLPSNAPYRIFADFTPTGAQKDAHGQYLATTIFEDIVVGDITRYKPELVGTITNQKQFGTYEVTLSTRPTVLQSQKENTLSFTLKKDGKLVTNLTPYLRALGHGVILKENTLEFIHTHPLDEDVKNQTGTVDFGVSFPEPGNYKIFTQFQHEGKILTTDFVARVENNPNAPEEALDHSSPNH